MRRLQEEKMLPDSRLRHLLSSKLMLLVVATLLLTPVAAFSADFDLVPTVFPNNVTEGNTVTFQVQVTGDELASPIYVYFDLSGDPTITTSDFSGGANVSFTDFAGTLTITGGVTDGQTVPLPIVLNDDVLVESDEFFGIAITGVSVGNGIGTPAVATIVDNDMADISIDDVTVTEGSGGAPVTASFTVSLSNALDADLTLEYATSNGTALAGSDYTGIATTLLTIPASQMSGTIDVTVIGDDVVEPSSQTFFVNLSNASAPGRNVNITDNQGLGTITDDGDTATVQIASGDRGKAVAEGDTNVTYTVELVGDIDAALTGDVTVSYGFDQGGTDTAEAADYADVTPGTVTLNLASRTYAIVLNIVDDAIVEPGEDFTFDLTGVSAPFDVVLGGASEIQSSTSIDPDGSDTATVQIASGDRGKAVSEG
ncbi:MAG: Calx-beta domain-containing protein, partial [Desulfobacterales bacterium]